MKTSLRQICCAAAMCVVPFIGCSQVPSYSSLSASDIESMAGGSENRKGTPQARDRHSGGASERAQFAKARDLEKSGTADEAIREYKRLTEAFPKQARAFHRLAVVYDVNGQADKSSREYLTAMHLAPNDNEILCDYGYSRYLQGDLHMAEDILREVVSRSPKMERGHNNLALVLARQDQDRDAIEEFQKAGCTPKQARANLKNARKAIELSSPDRP